MIPLHKAQVAKAEADLAAQQAAQLAAQQEAQRIEAQRLRQLEQQRVERASVQVAQVSAPSGSCDQWLDAAGITDKSNAMYIISRESGCNPNAINASSGAEGIPQALPYSKTGCAHGDAICQLRWMQTYVNERYGGWSGAVGWWRSHSWY